MFQERRFHRRQNYPPRRAELSPLRAAFVKEMFCPQPPLFSQTISLRELDAPLISRAMASILSTKEIKEALKDLPQWEAEGKAIERTFEFEEFTEAIDFVNGVAELAEEAEHHPDIEIHFSKVRLILSTHSKGGVTDADIDLAEKIDTLIDE